MITSIPPGVEKKIRNSGLLFLFLLPLLLLTLLSCQTPPEDTAQKQTEPAEDRNNSPGQEESGAMNNQHDGNVPLPVTDKPGLLQQKENYTSLRTHTFLNKRRPNQPAIDASAIQMAYIAEYPSRPSKLFLKPIDGRGSVQKTFGPSQERTPAFSPDGSKIAFSSDREGSWNIYIVNASNGGHIRQVTRETSNDLHPTFSPDGNRLAFASTLDDGNTYIYTWNLKTDQPTILGPGMEPAWSSVSSGKKENANNPFVNKIAFVRGQTSNGRDGTSLWLSDPQGRNVRNIYQSERYKIRNPSWSPDGRYIAFTAVKTEESDDRASTERSGDIWVIQSNGVNLNRITDTPAAEWHPVWGPDGRIYFVTTFNGHQEIRSVDPEKFMGRDKPPLAHSRSVPRDGGKNGRDRSRSGKPELQPDNGKQDGTSEGSNEN